MENKSLSSRMSINSDKKRLRKRSVERAKLSQSLEQLPDMPLFHSN